MKRTASLLILLAFFVGLSAPVMVARHLRSNGPPADNSSTQEASFAALPDDVVLQWNQIFLQVASTLRLPPPTSIRGFAIMHVAIFDSVNSIDRSFTPYLTDIRASRGASIEAAAAQAAHDVLVALYPQQQATFDLALAESLGGIPPGRAGQGVAVGQTVAQRILALRSTDGWEVTPPPYVLPTDPGNWQPTPPTFTPATFTHYPDVVPFALTGGGAQFRPLPPPKLTSNKYTVDFNEVKELGSVDSTVRTEDQGLAARLWGSYNHDFVWNQVAYEVAKARGNTLAENARLFALLHSALHDALLTSFASKFHYGLWRPVTAIRRADDDGNPATEADPDWTPLIAVPPYPTYAGNAATVGATAATILAQFFGREDIGFEGHFEGNPSGVRSYTGFWEMAEEEARSRIWGGIHFTFDSTAGQTIGRNVGHYVFQNFLTPRCRR